MKIHIEHTIDAGHRIVGHEGKCARLHGHTYKFEVTLEAHADSLVGPGFVADFGHVKEILDEWDHKMLLWEEDPLHTDYAWGHPTYRDEHGVLFLPFNPTAEHMASHLALRIRDSFENVYAVKMRVWETPKACAEIIV